MALVGQQGMPSVAPEAPVEDINTLGNEAFNRGDYRESIAQYSIALDYAPSDPLILWNRSAAYVLLGKYHEALQDIAKTARLLPPAQTILFRLAGIQTLAHQPHKALSTLRRLERTPEVLAARDLATLIVQAEDSLGEGACYNPEFAVIAMSVAEMKIRVPMPKEWILIRVRGKFETDDLKGAEEALAKIPADAVDAEVLIWKGKARLFRDSYIEAGEYFQAAMKLDPEATEPVTYLELAVAFQAKLTANVDSFGFGDKNKAVRILSEAIRTNLAHPPSKAKYLCYRAACLITLGYLTAAELDCESALYHVPNLARARRIQLQAIDQMTRNDEALRKDYYRVLGLERGRVSDSEVSRAFKESMLKYHPDKYGDNERARDMRQDIQAAFETLSDPDKRRQYDSGYALARRNSFNIVLS